jgi:hypothetical protein
MSFACIHEEAWHHQAAHLQDDRKQLLKQLEDKLSYIRDLLYSKQVGWKITGK